MDPALTSHKNDYQTHLHYLRACLSLAQQSPPKPTNFRVGAILLLRTRKALTPSTETYNDAILSTGYTLELPGNTHAEQCALAKYAASHGLTEERIGDVLPPPPPSAFVTPSQSPNDTPQQEQRIILYVTMEPCGKRLSGNTPCAARIVQTRRRSSPSNTAASSVNDSAGRASRGGIDKVYFGVKEPGTFVGGSVGCGMLDEAGVEWEVVEGMEEEILKLATAGHGQAGEKKTEKKEEEAKVVDGGQGTNVDDITEEERRRQAALPRNPKKRMMEGPLD
ncbi:hypothetical protein AJ78_05690 [Emergomyces pasteurianus Ep9510]|uniref:CMP/dCMP-type deaminase domain-containing protein n=1 Tax=Emergomyces pasteurianus Ep9510 TaxID=1447872 RepID=A0A1J9QD83_9EURO|nr:hypothetical protein AJ78_05690 [Emergomyces pasteurianus Ep9510]